MSKLSRKEFESILEEAYIEGYNSALEEVAIIESCGIGNDFIQECTEDIDNWLNTYTEASVPSPKELAMKIYEKVINAGKIVKLMAKEPNKTDKIKKAAKALAIKAAQFIKHNYGTIIKGIIISMVVSFIITIIVSFLSGVGIGIASATNSVGVLNWIINNPKILGAAFTIVIKGGGYAAGIKYIKDHIKMPKESKSKQESTEYDFDLESDFNRFVTE